MVGYPLQTSRCLVASTMLSLAFLAWLLAGHVGPWLGRTPSPPVDWTLTARGEPGQGAWLTALYLDGVRPLPAEVKRDPAWLLRNGQWFWAGDGEASIHVRASELVFAAMHSRLGGRLVVQRDGVKVDEINFGDSRAELEPRWHHLPQPRTPWWVWPAAAALLAGAAAAVRPWRSDRRAATWLLGYLTLANLGIWLGQPIGVTVDSGAYARAFGDAIAQGYSDYFPPGYSLFVEAARRLPFGLGTGAQLTLLQVVLLTVAGLWLWRLLRTAVGPGTAFAASLLAGSMPTMLLLARSALSEGLTVFATAGALWLTLRGLGRRHAGLALAAGVLGGIATITRVTPLVTILPFYLLHLRAGVRGVRSCLLSTAALGIVVAAPMLWFYAKSGHFELAWSSGGHVFNRLVYGQRLLDPQAPNTKKLLEWLGDDPVFGVDHVTLRWSLERKGHTTRAVNDLQAAVARESLRAYPFEYLLGTLVQAAEQCFWAPEASWADLHRPPEADLEDPPWCGVTRTALVWMQLVKRIEGWLWPIIAALGTLASVACLLAWRRAPPAFVGLAWIVPSTLLPQAMLDIGEGRRSATLEPVLVPLAMVAVGWLIRRRAHSGKQPKCLDTMAARTVGR